MIAAAANDLLRDARAGADALRSCAPDRLHDLVAHLHAVWRGGGAYRERFLASTPEHRIALSRPMVEWALDRFAIRIDPAHAFDRARLQLSVAAGGDGVVLRYEPLGTLLLVVSGNVCTGPAEALLAALVTRNAAIVKRPSANGEFLELFVESLAEAAPDLAAAMVVASWKGGAVDVERPLAEGVDGVVVAGDSETIAAYRRITPSTTPLVEFGPRASVAVVSRSGLETLDLEGLARDVALWDQLACSAAQAVYVEGEAAALQTAERLASALTELARHLPAGDVTMDERVEVARFRHDAAFAQSQGDARVFARDTALATVVFERTVDFRPTALRRTVRVKPYRHIEDLRGALAPARHLLQTVGLAVASSERARYEELLVRAGARRLCAIGKMNELSPVGAHDGMLELQRLVRWVECAQ